MKQTHKKIAICAMTILATACSSGNKGKGQQPTPITASQIKINTILPAGIQPTTSSNLFYTSTPSVYNFYWLSGIYEASKNLDPLAAVKFINVPISGSIMDSITNEDEKEHLSIMITSSEQLGSTSARGVWLINDFKIPESLVISATWKKGFIAESSANAPVFTTSFYPLAESAVAGVVDAPNNFRGLGIASLVPATESSVVEPLKLVSGFSAECALNSSDTVSSLNTTTHLNGGINNNYVEVGTSHGNICVYGVESSQHPGWHSLLLSTIKKGPTYKVGNPVVAIQALPYINNDYMYWSNSNGNIWRITLNKDGMNNLIEQLNSTNFVNYPQNINPKTLAIDVYNNVYIGGQAITNKATKVYVLPANSKTWRVVALPNALDEVTSISFAILDNHPVVSTTHKVYYLNNIPH